MWNTFIELSTLSMGVIPVLVVIFTVAFAVVMTCELKPSVITALGSMSD